jgi:hypothetical protein
VARLVCPLCGTVVVDGAEPAAGECPGCGARYAGGAGTPPEAVLAALAHWGLTELDAALLARLMFEVEPPPEPSPAAAITSDHRDGFYLWWVFARGATPEAAFEALAAGGGA